MVDGVQSKNYLMWGYSMALTYEDIKNLNWYIADRVYAKGNGNNNDAMSVAIPILIFKRLLDMRQEYKSRFNDPNFKEQYKLMKLYGDLNEVIANSQDNAPVFAVEKAKLDLWRLQWEDILAFPDEHDGVAPLLYQDGLDNASYVSPSHNKVEFIEELLESFATPKIREIFNYLDFRTKINSNNITQILNYGKFVEILNYMKDYYLSLSNAPSDVFSEAYMDLLKRFAPQKGSKQGEFFTPNNITKGATMLLNPELHDEAVTIVCDPTAGACTFMVEFSEFVIAKQAEKLGKKTLSDFERKEIVERLQIVIQEKDRVSFAAGEANLLLHGLLDQTKAFHGDTIEEYSAKIGGSYEGKCSYILANPPYGLDNYGNGFAEQQKKAGLELARWGLGVPNASDGEYAFLQTVIGLLNDKGKAVIVLPLGTLFRDSTSSTRQILIEQKDWVEGIILLPGKLFNTTDIPVCLWVINKNKAEVDKNKVFFVNAENDFTKNKNKNDWSFDKAVKAYISRTEEADYAKYVGLGVLKKNNFDLSVSKYVKKAQVKEVIDIGQTFTNIDRLQSEVTTAKAELSLVLEQVKLIYATK